MPTFLGLPSSPIAIVSLAFLFLGSVKVDRSFVCAFGQAGRESYLTIQVRQLA